MDDGTNFIWLKADESVRGVRCSKAIVDISTCSFEFISRILKPICIYAEEDDFEIVTSKDNIGYNISQFIDQLIKMGCMGRCFFLVLHFYIIFVFSAQILFIVHIHTRSKCLKINISF